MEALALMYRDIEGNLHSKSDVDLHHTFARSIMHGKGERQWANLGGLVLPMLKKFHNEGSEALHNNVRLCPKPDASLMYAIREHLYAIYEEENNNGEISVYDKFLSVNSYVHDIADHSHNIGLAQNAKRVGENLELQTPFILLGMVEVVEL